MYIDPQYDRYYVYSSIYQDGRQINFGACPVVWEDDVNCREGQWKRGLTWADGNYHLAENIDLPEDEIQFYEDSICSVLNDATATFGRITGRRSDCEVRWCLLDEPQVGILMDFPELLQAA